MYESIKSACKVLDRFGLPRAIGSLVTDRFIVANKSFLRVIGLGCDEISSVALSEIRGNIVRQTEMSCSTSSGESRSYLQAWEGAETVSVNPTGGFIGEFPFLLKNEVVVLAGKPRKSGDGCIEPGLYGTDPA